MGVPRRCIHFHVERWNSIKVGNNDCSRPSIPDKPCGVRGHETRERLREEHIRVRQFLICSLDFPFADTYVDRWCGECLGCRTLYNFDLFIESPLFQTRDPTPWFQTGEQTFPALTPKGGSYPGQLSLNSQTECAIINVNRSLIKHFQCGSCHAL